jgi:hypothetical protein
MVVIKLISMLNHKNRHDVEIALNSSVVLVELIEIEKSFELFFQNDGYMISKIIELAIDPSNQFNQKYLLQILLVVCKHLKPSSLSNNLFKDLEDEDSQEPRKFDKNTAQGKAMLIFMKFVKSHNLIYNLIIIINSRELTDDEVLINQYN